MALHLDRYRLGRSKTAALTLEAADVVKLVGGHSFIYRCSINVRLFIVNRLCSVTAILLELKLPCFDPILCNYRFSYGMQFACSEKSENAVVRYFVSIGM